MPTRAERLNFRFRLIQQTLHELHGRELAFGAATAAWLMALEYTHRQALLRLCRELADDAGTYTGPPEVAHMLGDEMNALLQSFHKELCEHLGVDQAESWQLAKAFKEVIHDICHQGG